ncbi:hypothetical protein PHYPSEUDO_006493 [Phytophthora pseudosyringae]|uniref:PH domain-containing protein n=1 Tax=Phytophthora pseudosyringae TaxID=221518 RepID=A0A8T1VLJ6_9STRA|nr:hypothetical protein PHYPSEUDO_006493 [Phytophthora pseudosyringae]
MERALEASASTVASSTDGRAMDVPAPRPRWKKALSLGSTASSADTDRCTDLDALDLEALAADGLFALHPESGAYSGWVHVATAGAAFTKRFCRLEELVCRFYASAQDAKQRARPVGRHVIISVRREHARNKTFALTDYEDRTLLLHTCLGADFELWYGTFAAVVRATQVAKSRGLDSASAYRRATTVAPPRPTRGARRLRAAVEEAQRLRALTVPAANGSLDGTATQAREAQPPMDGDDPERTHTVWLDMPAPWWRQLVLRRRKLRRYFVFSGTNVSCFSVNKEGKRAAFSRAISSCVHQSELEPTVVELECGRGLKKLRLSSSTEDGRNAVAATAKYIQRALDAASNEAARGTADR